MFLLAASFLILSGIASLSYQVAWVRLLGLSMGSTSASISTVLAAFFLGMAIGSYMAERITRNRINSLRPYIVLELCIGASGLALLPILLNLDSFMALAPTLGTNLGFKFALAMALLSIPTICMGATFPVMASILIRRQQEVGLRIGQLYSLNTAGAVLGAALSGFVFIPNWGLDGAIYIAFGLNMAIVLIATYFNMRWTLPPIETSAMANDSREAQVPYRLRALVVLFATGFVAIATQVGWTKYLAIFTGTTIYGFAAILTVFLTGIAAGSWAIKSFLERVRAPQVWMATGLLLLGISLILTRAGLSAVPTMYDGVNHLNISPTALQLVKALIVFILLFIPTFLFGALFPLNLKLYCGNLAGVRARIGKAYAVNTLASIFGAILAGFIIIPQFGTDALLTAMAIIILVLPLLFIPAVPSLMPRLAIASGVFAAAAIAWAVPHLSYKDLISSVDYQYDTDARAGVEPEFLFLKEGKAGIISMVTYDKVNAKLQNNGLNESVINLTDPNQALLAETLLALVPYMLHDNPKNAFVVGFGGGITTRAMTLTELESIRVVELEPAVVEAGRAIAGGEIPALRDPRVRINFNDARNTLLVEPYKYDIIAAQPSHPWLAGAANVFTRDFWQIIDSRLTEGGVFGQWVNLFKMDVTTLRSILKAFYEVFPYGMSFANLDTGDLVLFGGKKPLKFDYEKMAKIMKQPKIAATLNNHMIYEPKDLLWYFALSRNEAITAAGNAQPNTDTNILSEVRLSKVAFVPTGDEDPYEFLRAHFHLDLAPFIDDNLADKLVELINFYFSWNETFLADKAITQLLKIDPVRGRGFQFERLWYAHDYAAAEELFKQHAEWPDRTYQQYVVALLKQGRVEDAKQTITRIKDTIQQRVATAYLLYSLEDWNALAALLPQSDDERRWQLIGLAKSNLTVAGNSLVELTRDQTSDIPQMRVLLEYYASQGNSAAVNAQARRLTKTIDKEVEWLNQLAEEALSKNQTEKTEHIIQAIEELDPDATPLDKLKKRLAELGKTLANPAQTTAQASESYGAC